MINRTKRPRPARSLTATLAIAFFALSVVALLVSGVLQTYANFQTQQQAIASKQQLLAQGAATTVSNFIQNEISVMETTVRLGSPATASVEEQSRILNSLLGLQPAFRQVVLLDSHGQETALASRVSTLASGDITSKLTSTSLSQIQQGDKFISPVYFDDLTSEPFIFIIVPATSVLGDIEGYLLGEINLKFMWDLVDSLNVGNTGVAYVVDRQGNLIAYRDTARVLKGENVSMLRKVNEFTNNYAAVKITSSERYTGIGSTAVVGTLIPLGTPDWAVVTEQRLEEAYQQLIQQTIFAGIIILIIAVLASLVGVFLARRLAVPLIHLTETATRITSGETELQAEINGPREVASLATTFNTMTHELRQTLATLEDRVAERTHALQISTEISRRLSTILDKQALVSEVVEQVRIAFGYYHAQIYLYDDKRENLVMVGGTGEAGQTMLASEHKIVRGRGLVGRAADSNLPVLVGDTHSDASWLPNPLLPDTQSEAAVPIAVGDEVLGVLDVQHNTANGLTQTDVDLLLSIASQVAIALQNARSFANARRQADQDALAVTISQRIRQTNTVDDALQVAARELGRVVGAPQTRIRLGLAVEGE